MLKRFLVAGVVAGFAAAIPVVAFANSPHFISASSGLSGSSLTCTFKEAGLGNLGVTSIKITCGADASATYECVNGGNKNPEAANKETVTAPVSGSGSFPVRNGSTTGTLTVAAPGAGSFSCPGGQKLLLAAVSYTNVTVSGAGASQSLNDQMYVNPNAPPT
jgi:hypothetical protein